MEVTLSTAALALVPVIMAITSASKMYIQAEWSPLVSLGLSLLASFFVIPTSDIASTVIQGIILGLTAAGLYSGGKTTATALGGALQKKA